MPNSPRAASSSNMAALLISETVLLFACFCAAAYIIDPETGLFLLFEEDLPKIALVILIFQVSMFAQNLYRNMPSFRILLLQKCMVAIGTAFLAQFLLAYLSQDYSLPASYMMLGSLFALLTLSGWRILFTTVRRNLTKRHLLMIGVCPSMRSLAEAAISGGESAFTVAGYLHTAPVPGFPARYLGTLDELPQTLLTCRPSHILIATQQQAQPRVRSLLDLQWTSGLSVQGAPEFYEATWRRVSALDLQPDTLILSSTFWQSSGVSQLLSPVVGLLLLVLCSPVLLLTAAYLKFAAPSKPVLLRLPRTGLRGARFHLFRFRGTPLAALPALINLVRGDLAFVGPEPLDPLVETELEALIPFYQQRLVLRPGIWGWAQLNMYSSREDTLTSIEYDLYYIKNRSLHLNTYIFLHGVLLFFSK